MRNITEELYYGNICPMDRTIVKGGEYSLLLQIKILYGLQIEMKLMNIINMRLITENDFSRFGCAGFGV